MPTIGPSISLELVDGTTRAIILQVNSFRNLMSLLFPSWLRIHYKLVVCNLFVRHENCKKICLSQVYCSKSLLQTTNANYFYLAFFDYRLPKIFQKFYFENTISGSFCFAGVGLSSTPKTRERKFLIRLIAMQSLQ